MKSGVTRLTGALSGALAAAVTVILWSLPAQAHEGDAPREAPPKEDKPAAERPAVDKGTADAPPAVPPRQGGCGCQVEGAGADGALVALIAAGGLAARRRTRSRR